MPSSFEKWLRIVLPEVQLFDYVKQHGFITKKNRSSHIAMGSSANQVTSTGSSHPMSTAASHSPVSAHAVKEVTRDAKRGFKQLRTTSQTDNLDELFIEMETYLNRQVIGQDAFIQNLTTCYKKAFLHHQKGIVQQVLLVGGPKGTGKSLSLTYLMEQLYQKRLIPYRKATEVNLALYNEREIQSNFVSDCAAAFEFGIGTVVFKGINKAQAEIVDFITSLVSDGFFRTESGITIDAKDYFVIFMVEGEFQEENEALSTLPAEIRKQIDSTVLTQGLSKQSLTTIAKRLLQVTGERFASNTQAHIHYNDSICDFLSEQALQSKGYCTSLHEWIELDLFSALVDLRARNQIKANDQIELFIKDGRVFAKTDKDYLVLSISEDEAESLEELLKELHDLTGLNEVKLYVKELMDTVKVQKMRKDSGKKGVPLTLHMIFSGNPGTGKTTVARLLGRILQSMGVLSKGQLVETARQDLVGQYLGSTAPKTNAKIHEAKGGVLFIDEAYTLSREKNDPFGQEAIDTLVKGMEDHRDDLVVILAGYTNEMNDFLKSNPGLPSRFPFQVEFPDYTPREMLEISHLLATHRDYQIEEDANTELVELFERKQIPGRNDSGNGRLVRNLLEEAIRKQSARLAEQEVDISQLQLLTKDDFGLTVKEPFQLEDKLSDIIGLVNVKTFLRTLEKQILVNQRRKEAGIEIRTEQTLNMIFSGNPGTGKTTIGRYVAEMLKHLGVIKKGHLVEVGRTELVSGYAGQTAEKTKEVVESALGGVLFIDEAYALVDKNSGGIGEEAINELVRLVEIHKDNLVVILAGYSEDMEGFLRVNPGLASRFPLQLEFPDYSSEELVQIAEAMAIAKGFTLEEGLQKPLKKWYDTKQIVGKKDSGNGRLVRNALEEAIRNQAVRIADEIELTNNELVMITKYDFNLEEQEVDQSAFEELEAIIGLSEVKDFAKSLFAQIEMRERRKSLGLPDIGGQSLHMVFKGNPGTGKTTIARIIAKRLKEINVIKSDTLIETDRSGLVAGYVGQTALKTKEVIDRALGGVLFIDEAYSLASDSFGREAIDTLVKAMEDYKDELVIIVAGYNKDMEDFLNVNAGLRSRFPHIIEFPDYTANELLKISRLIFHSKGYKATKEAEKSLLQIFKESTSRFDSGNGRLVRNNCEEAIRVHAVRYATKPDATIEELSTIDADDVRREVRG
ncbi:AAA family ATPase [Alkalihalophilus sp. As8PL]|uniref:AAA family ATPase n=1 Tax=Alkalihalophilus sp. As8PL TaxID=3237103 RepID=A0AB39BST1_9BACI